MLLVAVTVAHAADNDGKFAIKGIGNTTCADFLAFSESESYNKFLYAGWINGYLTAQNQHLNATFDLSSWQTIHTLGEYLRNYCKKNPKNSFYIAVASMINGLHERRIQTSSPVKKIGTGNNAVLLYQESLVRAQKNLQRLGLYKGTAEGEISEGTKKAISKFQEQHKLPVTGIPDQQTLHLLLMEID